LVDLATRGKIFISYRRDDSPGDARGVRDRLSREFGKANVFMDVDNLLAGQRFDRELDNALAQCDVLVAVIGLRWMKLVSGHVRSGERDFVHDEIAAALKREIVVIPALIGRKGNMPPLPRRDDLPADIRDLVLHQKQDIAHESFGRDADDLTAAIKSVLRGERRAMPWRTIAVSGAMALILAVVLSGYWMGIIPGLGSGSSVNPLRSGPDGPTVLAPSNADRAPADKGAKKTAAAARESVRQAAEETKRQADVDTASKKAEEEAAEKKAAAACEGLATSLGTPTDRLLSSIDEAAACINGMRRYPSVALLGYQAGGRAANGGNNYTLAARLYRAAAENGGIDAMVDLGGLYRDGHGLAQDYVEHASGMKRRRRSVTGARWTVLVTSTRKVTVSRRIMPRRKSGTKRRQHLGT
jgi:hypothetical protein